MPAHHNPLIATTAAGQVRSGLAPRFGLRRALRAGRDVGQDG